MNSIFDYLINVMVILGVSVIALGIFCLLFGEDAAEVGKLMMCGNYSMYKKILASRKEKYAGEIIELSEKIMNVE